MAINNGRSARKTDEFLKLNASTTEIVAPGSYDESRKVVQESAVPFDSLQERTLNPITSTAKITPGPGAYLGQDVIESAQGHDALPAAGVSQTSFKSKQKRLGPTAPGSSIYSESTIAKNPGPGTYGTEGTIAAKQRLDDKVAVRPVLEVQDKTIPSMPQTRFLPNQEPETEAAKADIASLCCRHTGEPSDMAGPGEYDPRGDALTSKTDPRTIFHPPTGKCRNLWEPSVAIESIMPPKEIPGPGSYDAKPEEDPVTARGAAHKFNSRVPMAHEMETQVERIVPGPGAYEVLAEIDRMTAQLRERGQALGGERYQFGSATERVGWSRDVHQPFKDAYNVRNVPGPGHYPGAATNFKDPKTGDAEKVLPGAAKKKLYGVHHPTIVLALQEAEGPLQAFNSTDDRPCNKEQEQTTPAPWQYNRENARGESMNSALRERAKVGRKGVFGTCADRFFGSPLNAREGLPDPSFDGGGANMSAEGAGPDTRSSFKSSTPRMRESAGPGEVTVTKVGSFQTPAPGTYVINQEPNYRSPYRVPRQDHLSFGSCSTRFTENKDVFSSFQLPSSHPPPGSYEPPASNKRVTGAPKLKDKRKPLRTGCTSEQVGPGSYGGDNDTTLLKKTFNVTTQAPLSARPARPRMGSNVSQGSFY